jgi:osmotically inducible protein OsmC
VAEIQREAHAIWNGNLRKGEGNITTASNALRDESYSFGTRFEQKPGTNPEELIAAAHAACYSMALANTLDSKGYPPERIKTHATCFLTRREGGGFRISKMHLEVEGWVPGLSQIQFQQIAGEADQGCPVSNLLRSGLKIELEASLK